jgi:dihydropteroate synthase-like protein
MPENLLFLTGKLAEKSLHRVLAGLQPQKSQHSTSEMPAFNYRIAQLGITVAALMTPEFIARRLPDSGDADRIVVPGLCRGDLQSLEKKYGVPVERGPEDLNDLPEFFGHAGKRPDLSRYDVNIFAEIVEAPHLTIEQILVRAQHYRSQGADVIDLGCLANTPFPHLPGAIDALKAGGFKVSVDSMADEDLLLAGKSGADYLLSLNEKNLWIADQVASIPVLIPHAGKGLPSLYRAIDVMQKKGRPFIADAILDPVPFGLTESIVRYQLLRKRYPDIQIMMGTGNLTELIDADTAGINAVLFGIISELNINAVLTTSVSPHAVNVVAEADAARRMMFAAREDDRLPRSYSDALLCLHDKRAFSYSSEQIAEFAAQIKDPSFRIQISEEGMHVYNRDGLFQDTDPFRLYPHLKVDDDASHAFYLGVELARAQIAWQLKKRYNQDEELKWGCNTVNPDAKGRAAHRSACLKEKKAKK